MPSVEDRNPRILRDPRKARAAFTPKTDKAPVVTTARTYSGPPAVSSTFPLDSLLPPNSSHVAVADIPLPETLPPNQIKSELWQEQLETPVGKESKPNGPATSKELVLLTKQSRVDVKTDNNKSEIGKSPDRLDVKRKSYKRSSSERDKLSDSPERESRSTRSKGGRNSDRERRRSSSDDEHHQKRMRRSKDRHSKSRSRSPTRTRFHMGYRGRIDVGRYSRGKRTSGDRRGGSRERDTEQRDNRDEKHKPRTSPRPARDETKFTHRGKSNETKRSYRKKESEVPDELPKRVSPLPASPKQDKPSPARNSPRGDVDERVFVKKCIESRKEEQETPEENIPDKGNYNF